MNGEGDNAGAIGRGVPRRRGADVSVPSSAGWRRYWSMPDMCDIARAIALFIGLYSCVNVFVALRTGQQIQDLWWIDLRFLGTWLSVVLGGAVAILLVLYGLRPVLGLTRRVLTSVACVLVVAVGVENSVVFYQAWTAGSFEPGMPIPFSAVVAVTFVWLVWAVWHLRPQYRSGLHAGVRIGGIMVLLAVVFPLAQIAFFGTSDYRIKADVAVVFGARVWSDGTVSPSLQERLDTAIDLYRDGFVRTLIMSGGIDENGHDEAMVMAQYAIDQGVPADAIIMDNQGTDTDATAANTTAIFTRVDADTVLAVSQNYHLPRIKLAYRAIDWEVRTVPAEAGAYPIRQTPRFIAREVPAFWAYWLRSAVRAVRM